MVTLKNVMLSCDLFMLLVYGHVRLLSSAYTPSLGNHVCGVIIKKDCTATFANLHPRNRNSWETTEYVSYHNVTITTAGSAVMCSLLIGRS